MTGTKTVKIGEMVRINKGKKVASNSNTQTNGSRRYIQIDDLRNDNNLKFTLDSGISVKEKDVVIAWDGANAGTIGYGLDGIIGSTLAKLEIQNEHLVGDFLGRFLQNKFQYLRDRCTGATIPHISRNVLVDLTIPLPTLEEQKRIVRILDQADSLRQKRQKAISLLDDYLKAVFLEMFGDPHNNIHNFPIGIIGDLVSEVKYGTSKKAEENGEYIYLRMNNITYRGELDLSALKYINLDDNEKSKYLAQRGDILFNRTNSKELVGKTAVYDLDEPMAIAGYLIRVRVNEKAFPEYISGYLNSKHGKLTLEKMCKNIVGMANINAKELQKIRIIVPPRALQEKYAQIVKKNRALKAVMKKQYHKMDTNFNALMQGAFAT